MIFNKFKPLSLFLIITSLSFLPSCMVLVPVEHHDNGKHKGWYKGKGNPHNSNKTIIIKEKNSKKKHH